MDPVAMPIINPVTHYQMTNFRPVQIERNCRQHFKVHLKWKISTIQGRKHCKKMRIATYNFSFSHNVIHSYISLVRQNVVLCGTGTKGIAYVGGLTLYHTVPSFNDPE